VLDQPAGRLQAPQRPPRADHVEVDVGAVAGDDVGKVLLVPERQDGEVVQGIARGWGSLGSAATGRASTARHPSHISRRITCEHSLPMLVSGDGGGNEAFGFGQCGVPRVTRN
jgi:hypothetical protein